MTDEYQDTNDASEHLQPGLSSIQPLDQDIAPPYSPPTDAADNAQLDPTHQATDNANDIDSHELYDEGLAGAAEANEPNADNAVVDYNPDTDQRQ